MAVLGTKHLLNYSMNHTVDEGLLYTKVWNMAMLQADDLTAAFTAYVSTVLPLRCELTDDEGTDSQRRSQRRSPSWASSSSSPHLVVYPLTQYVLPISISLSLILRSPV